MENIWSSKEVACFGLLVPTMNSFCDFDGRNIVEEVFCHESFIMALLFAPLMSA